MLFPMSDGMQKIRSLWRLFGWGKPGELRGRAEHGTNGCRGVMPNFGRFLYRKNTMRNKSTKEKGPFQNGRSWYKKICNE